MSCCGSCAQGGGCGAGDPAVLPPGSGFIFPAPPPTPDNAFLEGRAQLRRMVGLAPRGSLLGGVGLGQTTTTTTAAPAGGSSGATFPSATAMSLAGAAALGFAGWWVSGKLSKDKNAQLAGGAIGAIAGLTLF